MKKFFWFGFFVIALLGCDKKPVADPEGNRDIVVFFSSQSILTSQLKAAATADEKIIKKVVLFGFDASGNLATNGKWVITDPLLSGQKLSAVSKYVHTIWAIANPTDDLANANPANVTELKALTADYTKAPESPFMMSGKGNVTNYSATIQLYFVVAKVQIIPVGFTITSVAVKNTLNRVFVFDENLFNGSPLAIPSVPSGSGVTRVDYASPSTLSEPFVFYVAENNANNTTNSTKFVISGTIDGSPINYNLELKLSENIIPVKRNTHYTVSISPTEGTVIITIPEWNDQPTQDHQF